MWERESMQDEVYFIDGKKSIEMWVQPDGTYRLLYFDDEIPAQCLEDHRCRTRRDALRLAGVLARRYGLT